MNLARWALCWSSSSVVYHHRHSALWKRGSQTLYNNTNTLPDIQVYILHSPRPKSRCWHQNGRLIFPTDRSVRIIDKSTALPICYRQRVDLELLPTRCVVGLSSAYKSTVLCTVYGVYVWIWYSVSRRGGMKENVSITQWIGSLNGSRGADRGNFLFRSCSVQEDLLWNGTLNNLRGRETHILKTGWLQTRGSFLLCLG